MRSRMKAVAVACVAVLVAVPAVAATFAVTAADDLADFTIGDGICDMGTGWCTLRAAIQEANAQPGPDTITIPFGTCVRQLPETDEDHAANGDLDVTEDLAIVGLGVTRTIIDARNADRVFDVMPGATLTLEGVAVLNGRVIGDGACVRVRGASLVATDCSFARSIGSPVFVFDDCHGGGIAVTDGRLELTRCSVFSNEACGGGGLYAALSTVTISECEIADNRSASAGGAALIDVSDALHRVVFARTMFWLNRATTGGALSASGLLGETHLVNCTLTGNTATASGSAVDASAQVGLVSCTVTANGAAPPFSSSAAPCPIEIEHVITSGNGPSGAPDDLGCAVWSNGHDLIETPASWRSQIRGPATGDVFDLSPLLGPLANNGGPTRTQLPGAGSPAIDAGDPAGCLDWNRAPLTIDQRVQPRPFDGDGDGTSRCDIGAVEVGCGTDSDGDGAGDACDCAPTDGTATSVPAEPSLLVTRVALTEDAVLAWTDTAAGAGSGTRYDVASGSLSALHAWRVADGPCVATALATTTWSDARPITAGGFYHLVRAINACTRTGTGWGTDSFGAPHPACP